MNKTMSFLNCIAREQNKNSCFLTCKKMIEFFFVEDTNTQLNVHIVVAVQSHTKLKEKKLMIRNNEIVVLRTKITLRLNFSGK